MNKRIYRITTRFSKEEMNRIKAIMRLGKLNFATQKSEFIRSKVLTS